jgi:hypothetical protein
VATPEIVAQRHHLRQQHRHADVMHPDDLVARFDDRTLPKSAWTHDAHLTVCLHAVRRMPVDAAVDHLRAAIRAFNEATDTPNTTTAGYHETLTRYYVGAVAHLGDVPLDAVLAHPACTRDAPLRHWERPSLFSVDARMAWLEPDLAPLPW